MKLSEITELILSQIESDTSLRDWARSYTGNSNFTFYRNKDDDGDYSTEHLTIIESIDIEEFPFTTMSVNAPLHIFLGLPSVRMEDLSGRGTCYRDVLEYTILGYVYDASYSKTEAVQDFADELRKALGRIDYNLYIEIEDYSFLKDVEQEGTLHFVMRLIVKRELAT